jgi:hypothetical protein
MIKQSLLWSILLPVDSSIEHRAFAVILPVEAYRRYRTARKEGLEIMRKEFVGLVSSNLAYPGRQSLEAVKAQPAVLPKKIEEEGE